MVQGAIGLDWHARRMGLLPRTENSDIHTEFVPNWNRFKRWISTGVHVEGNPNWAFVKLHTHGCKPGNIDLWLSSQTREFHQAVADGLAQIPNLKYYYVTAWEMAQLVHQAENGAVKPDFESAASGSNTALVS